MKKNNIILLFLLFFILVGFNIENSNVEGLSVKFRKVSENHMRPGPPNGPMGSTPIVAFEGMKFVKLKLTLKNNGDKDCVFDFEDVYLSTEQDSLYRFAALQIIIPTSTRTKIKPQKEINRVVFFEFPEKAKPNELFIEDKVYKVIEEE